MKWYKQIVFFLVMTVAAWSAIDITDGCDLPDSETISYLHLTADGSVLFKTLYPIGGFQFTIDGATVMDASGGSAGDAGFIVSTSATEVLGFSLSGATIEGCGTLTVVTYEGDATGISGIVMADAIGNSMYFEYYEGDIPGCMDMDACNYNADATEDDGSCVQPEENYDCDGNCTAEVDCAGECGGSALEDECGVCDGDGSDDVGCGCFEPSPSGCDNACGSNLENDACGVCGGSGIAEGDCDCDGNVDLGCGCGADGPSGCDMTCGSTLENDECGVCDGDGSDDVGCGCFEPGPSGCDEECGSTLELDECGVCDGSGSCLGCTDDGYQEWSLNPGIAACNYDASATIADGSCNYPIDNFNCDGECTLEDGCNDCFGIINGTAKIDDCGKCIDCSLYSFGNSCYDHPAWNQSCTDCAGELNGNAFIDACEDCVGDTPDNPACIFDCEGSIGYGSYDNCGECDDDFANDCEIDCYGIWGGQAEIDDCSVCTGGATELMFNYLQDCNDDCGGTAIYDNCGICGGDGSDDVGCGCFEAGPSGCDNSCGSALVEDECGICGGDNSSCSDCAGTPNGNAIDLGCGCGESGPSGCDNSCGSALIEDECGICGGDNSSCSDCAGTPNGNAIDLGCGCGESGPSGCDNSCGSALIEDECGICGGDGSDDVGCGCFESGPSGCDNSCGSALVEDECGICGGDNTSCSWTNLTAEVEGINQIALSWDVVDSRSNRNNRSGRECTGEVCLYIENVDTDAGTLDIYMENIEPVGGFQFELPGITVTGASAPAGFMASTSATSVLAFSLTGATIPAGEGILTQVSFSDFEDESICFGTEPANNVIADPVGDSLYTIWGDCFQVDDCEYDECGVCDGGGIADGACDCYGNVEDECGECDGDNSTCVDCADVPNGDSELDNCGTCDNDPSNDCDMDCSGDWGGSLVNDECGECGGPGLGSGSYYMDCWDGSEYCSNSDCPIDPSAVSYKIYRSGLGIAIAEVQGETGYTDIDLDYDQQYCYTVTYVNSGVESYHSNQACAITDEMPIVEGCISTYACNYNESATVDDGSCWFVNTGCSCEVGQGAETDNCGVCDTDFTNDCIPDCNGDWGGLALVDECGVCGGNGISDGECNCNGNILDECGVCGGNGISDGECDCNGNILDECGVCGGSGIPDGDCDCNGNVEDCTGECGGSEIVDCNDVCGGSSVVDSCGVCDGPGDIYECGCFGIPDEYCDCDQTVAIDECGICGGESFFDGNGEFPDGSCDCLGNVFDECSICGGDGAVFGETADCCEVDIDCFGNCNGDAVEDCAGECGGTSELDACGNCGGDCEDDGTGIITCSTIDVNVNNLIIADICGVCDGDGIMLEDDSCCASGEIDCADVCDGNGEYLDDGETCCASGEIDCAGVCDGDSIEDYCGICEGINSDPDPEDSDCGVNNVNCPNIDCNGDCFGNALIDCADVCNGDSIEDDCGVCGGESFFTNNNGEICTENSGADCALPDGACSCYGQILDCAGVCGGDNFDLENTSCFHDIDGNFCDLADVGPCGLCFGLGVLEGFCDCFNNIANCEGECRTIYSGEPGIWQENPDYDPITDADLDFDGICDDIDDCISDGSVHLIFDKDGNMISDSEGNYNAFSGGYDRCGYCNGDGFLCGFNSEGGLNKIELNWNIPKCGGLEEVDCGSGNRDSGYNSDEPGHNEPRNSSEISAVSLEIQNVDTDDAGCTDPDYNTQATCEAGDADWYTGTLDIYMFNYPGCSYCEDLTYNNNSQTWTEKKEDCEVFGNSSWVSYANITEEECANIPSLDGNGGWWFNGKVGGFQFKLPGVTITGASGGTASEYFAIVNTTSSTILGFDMSGGTIPPGEGILTQVTFTDFAGEGICFGTDPAYNVISDAFGGEVSTEWGDCFCGLDYLADDCGECGGESFMNNNGLFADGTCDCSGNFEDECGDCGGNGPGVECWDNEMVCSVNKCSPNPNAISYNVYKQDVLKNYYQIASFLPNPIFVDENLGYEQEQCYAISYLYDANQNGQFDFPEEEFYKPENNGGSVPLGGCEVTSSLIEGCTFASACNYDEDSNYYDGSCWWESNQCACSDGEEAVSDNCGVCDSNPVNDCVADCLGEWGGPAEFDECGICDSDSSNDNLCHDCNGDPFGDAYVDECDECVGGSTDLDPCIIDCFGIPDGDAYVDECGGCVGGDTGSFPCVQDCDDVWGGEGEMDLFGACCTATEESSCIITGCDLPDSTVYLTETSMAFNSSKAIKQIKLTLEGSVIPSSPLLGAAGDAGFNWLGYSDSSNWVKGGGQSALIPAGCGVLFNITYINNPVFISAEIKDENNTVIGFSSYFDSGCIEETACNYNPYTIDYISGSCNYPEEEYLDCSGECLNDFDEDGVCDELSLYDSLIPTTYTVNDIYPNPFNPIANIIYGIPENAHIRILVFDIRGRKVAKLMDSFQFAGYHAITWDASSQPSGVYLVKILSGRFNSTQKVVLMK